MTLTTHTYLPARHADLDGVSKALEAGEASEYALVGPGGRRVALPAEIHDVLVGVVEAMRAGKAVHLTPSDEQLTTQQAADMLGISRPTLIAIIDRGELACTRVSSHRRIRLDDLLAYRDRRRAAQRAVLEQLQSDHDDEASADEILAAAKAARKAVAARRARRDA